MMWENDDSARREADFSAATTAEDVSPRSAGFWSRLRTRFGGGGDKQGLAAERLIDLSRAIEAAPEVSSNYLYRGEVYLELGRMEQALEDFSTALALAEQSLKRDRWGLVAQAVRDRALVGLEEIQKRSAAS